MERTLILVGMMGAGKSAVGRLLAARRRAPFIDVDEEVEKQCGMPIAEIFSKESEKSFRQSESRALEAALKTPGAVIATGGGAPLLRENREMMKRAGVVVYLRARAQTLARRLENERAARPLLNNGAPLEKTLADILAARADVYENAAHFAVDVEKCEDDSAQGVAQVVVDGLSNVEN